MEFKSKTFLIFLWILLLVFIGLDVLVYSVVIIPKQIDFGVLENIIYFIWFAGKLGIVAMLITKRGRTDLGIYITLSPIFLGGLYCATFYPFTSGVGFTSDSFYNVVICVVIGIFGFVTHRCVKPVSEN